MSTVIHWHRPAHEVESRHELRVSVMEGGVQEITDRLVAKIRSQGHEVIGRGGDFTAPDGGPRANWFDVIVKLEGSEPMAWQHTVTLPDSPWPLALRDFDDYLDAVTARAAVMPNWRRGQVHFNVLENNRKDLADQIRGTDLDPFHDESRVPAYLLWVGQHWAAEATA